MNNSQKYNKIDFDISIKNAIIIFIKNPQLGKVKTRLAATLGNERALEIYNILMAHTENITHGLSAEKYLYYTDFVDKNDIWPNNIYHKFMQHQEQDLGLKMAHAFRESIDENCSKVLIIGSDCLELTENIINDAFSKLDNNEVVIGPANDGGYYLIGFNFQIIGEKCREVLQEIFIGKQWSHENVCQEAINVCKKLNLKYTQLKKLIDIDQESDLRESLEILNDIINLKRYSTLKELMKS